MLISVFFEPRQGVRTGRLASQALFISIAVCLFHKFAGDSASFKRAGYKSVDDYKRTIAYDIFHKSRMPFDVSLESVCFFEMSDIHK